MEINQHIKIILIDIICDPKISWERIRRDKYKKIKVPNKSHFLKFVDKHQMIKGDLMKNIQYFKINENFKPNDVIQNLPF
jgi:hypothetical protein